MMGRFWNMSIPKKWAHQIDIFFRCKMHQKCVIFYVRGLKTHRNHITLSPKYPSWQISFYFEGREDLIAFFLWLPNLTSFAKIAEFLQSLMPQRKKMYHKPQKHLYFSETPCPRDSKNANFFSIGKNVHEN